MKSMKRVVVTGMGAITPIGNSVEEFWSGVKEQKIGFAPITYFDATEYKAHLAAEVKGFNAKDYMKPKAEDVWNYFHSMLLLHQRKQLKMQDWTLRKKIQQELVSL